MKTVTLICGVQGDGKTTLANKLIKDPETQVAIAADDMPGLYEKEVYQIGLQRRSHEWCREQVIYYMKKGFEDIIVHNTFTRNFYRQPYIKLAQEYGYATHIVTSEGIVLPDGQRTISTHSVPLAVVQSARQSWEAFNSLPKKGICSLELAQQILNLPRPEVIIFDMDKTVKRPPDGRSFPQSPDDFELTPEFKQWIVSGSFDRADLYIASNQRSVEGGQKSESFLKAEVELLDKCLKDKNVVFKKMYFATKRNSRECLVYENGQWDNLFNDDVLYDKPNNGMFQSIASNKNSYWIVGDAHTDNSPEDWQFAKSCQSFAMPFRDIDVRYIPIEILNLVLER